MNNLDKQAQAQMLKEWYVGNEKKFAEAHARGLQPISSSYPFNIYVEPVNACNLACPFCATTYETRTRTMLGLDVFERLIRDLKEKGIYPRITLTGEGEPFLNKQAIDMVRIAKEAGFNVWTITNGSMFDRARLEKLLEYGINRVQFSIDSVTKEIYDRMRVAKGKHQSYFAKTMGNILYLAKRNYEEGLPIYISISAVQTKLNAPDAQAFTDFWMALPVHNVFLAPLSTLQANTQLEEAKDLFYQGSMAEKQVCAIPFTTANVNADGSVNICSHDFDNVYPVGNVADESFGVLWNNAKSQALRKALLDGEVSEFVAIGHDCQRCNNPVIGYGVGDCMKSAQERIERTVSVIDGDNQIENGERRYARLLELIEEYPILG